MNYLALTTIYERLESTAKRLEKIQVIAEFLKELPQKDLAPIVLLLQGRVFPIWDETKLGVASKLVLSAIAKATGAGKDAIMLQWKKTGDLGIAAQNVVEKKTQATLFSESLSVQKVFTNLKKLAQMQGSGATERKQELIAELLTSAKPQEARYIVRTILEDLRVGIGEGSLRDAIVWAYFDDKIDIQIKEKDNSLEIGNREEYNACVDAVQQAYNITNDFSVVAAIAKESGLKGLLGQELVVGKPIKVMLALKVNDAKEALERVGTPAQAEYKLDGFRIQIHKLKEKITLYTRRLEDVTAQFPDAVKTIAEQVKAESCILDAEVVGIDKKTGKYLPFQSISQRIKRKYNIDEVAKKFPVELNVFDLLYANGKNLIQQPFKERRAILEKTIKEKPKSIQLVRHIITEKEPDINSFFKQALKEGTEGLMIKNLESPYKPGARVGYMVKLKETMENLDLVITGAEWGEGKRSAWLSSFVISCMDEDGNFLEIGKVSTGFKEKEEEGLSFKEMTELLKPLIISEKNKEAKVKPAIILEVAYEEIQKSNTYPSGFALRFPRVVRLRSDERNVDDITPLNYIEELYHSQKM